MMCWARSVMTTNNELMELSHLDTMLARATRIDEIVGVRAIAKAATAYATSIKESRECCQGYAAARIRAERKCGEMLSLLDLHGSNQHSRRSGGPTSLDGYGITKDEAYRWKLIAKLPDIEFEKNMLERIQSNDDITTDFFVKAYRIHTMRQRGISTDRPYTPPTTIAISTTDMAAAAAVIRDKLSMEQVTALISALLE